MGRWLLDRSETTLTTTGKTRGWADAQKGNHRSRRMGFHRSTGNGAGRAGAASTETPTAGPYGGYQEAVVRWLPAWNRHPAPRPGKVQVVSRHRSADDL